jgi:phenylacetate-coenzyme A ligase PaaK-like adenylate-forming protein
MPATGRFNSDLFRDEGLAGIEYLPAAELLSVMHQRFKDTAVIQHALALPIYRKQWAAAGIKKMAAGNLPGLRQLPFLTREDLVHQGRDASAKTYAGRHIQLWSGEDILGDAACWFPRGKDDIAHYVIQTSRMARILELTDIDRVLVLTRDAPACANMLPYSLVQACRELGVRTQIIPINIEVFDYTRKWMDFILQIRPTLMLASPDDALKLAEVLARMSGIKGGSPDARLLPALRLVLLHNCGSEQQCAGVRDLYQVQTHLALGLVDLGLFGMECPAGDGIHLWLDNGVYELIPDAESERERRDKNYIPSTVWLWEAAAGMTGELVITNYSRVMPLIRYRTGHRVESMGQARCACGRTHPRVKMA